ncbi:MAG: hypothetical protein IH861_06315 [Chloroflexi bacterium]|nr:hypothetical protein [Chloroflexota bacterium]
MLKKGLVIGGLAIAAVAVIGASSAFAHSPFGGGKGRAAVVETAGEELGMSRADLVDELRAGNSIAQVAENQGVDVNDIVSAILGKVSNGLNRAVENGRMTQEQADSRLGNISERVASAMERVPNFDGQRAKGKWRGNRGNHGLLVVAAGELDMTPGELLAELREGKSIAEVAEAMDVSVDDIIGAMVEKAEERMAMFEDKVTERINEPWQAKPAHAGDGGRGGRQFGPGHGRGPGIERHSGGESGDASVLTDQIEKTDL